MTEKQTILFEESDFYELIFDNDNQPKTFEEEINKLVEIMKSAMRTGKITDHT